MSKKCPECGKFMALTDLLPDEDEFDDELAAECGLTDEQRDGDPFEPPLCTFRYVQNLWECNTCDLVIWHTEGPRYYYDYNQNWYYADSKPLTPKEIAARERQAQENAGQMKLFSEEQS